MSIDSLSLDALAWIVLRAVYGWMYLYPAYGLIKDWESTIQTTALLFKWRPELFAFGSLLLMVFGALAILFGIYGQIAAFGLIGFNLGGAVLHYRLARTLKQMRLSSEASRTDQAALEGAISLGVVGHVTSAEKNFVLKAQALGVLLLGWKCFLPESSEMQLKERESWSANVIERVWRKCVDT